MINFSCQLIEYGWLEVTLVTKDIEEKFTASYLSDAANDLIIGLALLLEGQNETICLLEDEPGEYRWLFRRLDDYFELKILRLEDTFSRKDNDNAELIFYGTEDLRKFAHRVLRQFNLIKSQHTVDGYKKTWGHEFPSKAIERLRFASKN